MTAREPITIRPAGDGDIVAITTIYNQGIADRVATLETSERDKDERRAWLGGREGRHPVVVAERGGGVVGWGSLNSFNPRPAYRHVADISVYVERSARGTGVGRALLDRLVELGRDLDYHKLVLATFGELHPAVVAALGLTGAVAAFEVFLDRVPEPKRRRRAAPDLPAFQPVRRDFAFLVDAAVPAEAVVRAARGAERALIAGGDWVAEGRDIGSVVAPDAAVKVFLTATPEERARRRAAENGGDAEQVLRELSQRDQRDASADRTVLEPAPDAVPVDTTGLSLDEVVDHIVALVETSGAGSR